MDRLSDSIFKDIVTYTPLIAIDLIIQNDEDMILLGKRKNKPAQGKWFVPGGRIMKNETMKDAFLRISKDELGFELEPKFSHLMGVFEHHYDDSIFGDNISTHYVVLAYRAVVYDQEPICDEQHEKFKWVYTDSTCDDIHKFTLSYMRMLCR